MTPQEMNKEKYYTPEIEEFHVGFEFEYRGGVDAKWERKVFTSWDNTEYNSWVRVSENIPNSVAPIFYRVKYLDKEDIESLGWKPLNEKFDYFKLNTHKLCLNTDNNICIYDDCMDIVFNGTVKNKSELKRLMKQLSITE